MEKSNNRYKTYKSLSRHEATLLNAIEPFLLCSVADIRKVTGWEQATIRNTLFSLKKKKVLVVMRKGQYVLAEKVAENVFALATLANQPSYVSFWTACSYYGLTEQQVKMTQLVSTKQYPLTQFEHFRIETTTFQPSRFYGYQRSGNFAITEQEKLIVDCLYKPENAGGIGEFQKCLRAAWPTVNQQKLKEYILKFRNKAVGARLGYLLEELRLSNKLVRFLHQQLPQGYTRLNPRRKPTDHYNHRWRIIINDQ